MVVCLYGTRKESYFLGALAFSLMADVAQHIVLMCLFRACP